MIGDEDEPWTDVDTIGAIIVIGVGLLAVAAIIGALRFLVWVAS